MKILVCGSRNPNRFIKYKVLQALDYFAEERKVEVVIQGGADGVDACAKEWARVAAVECVTVPADWAKYGRAAGPIRNKEMLNLKPDIVVAFPGGKGTANMVRLAMAAGVQVWEPYP